jgi:hypothetical protein
MAAPGPSTEASLAFGESALNLGMTVAGKLDDAEYRTQSDMAQAQAQNAVNTFLQDLPGDPNYDGYAEKYNKFMTDLLPQIEKMLTNQRAKNYVQSWMVQSGPTWEGNVHAQYLKKKGDVSLGNEQATVDNILLNVASGKIPMEQVDAARKSIDDAERGMVDAGLMSEQAYQDRKSGYNNIIDANVALSTLLKIGKEQGMQAMLDSVDSVASDFNLSETQTITLGSKAQTVMAKVEATNLKAAEGEMSAIINDPAKGGVDAAFQNYDRIVAQYNLDDTSAGTLYTSLVRQRDYQTALEAKRELEHDEPIKSGLTDALNTLYEGGVTAKGVLTYDMIHQADLQGADAAAFKENMSKSLLAYMDSQEGRAGKEPPSDDQTMIDFNAMAWRVDGTDPAAVATFNAQVDWITGAKGATPVEGYKQGSISWQKGDTLRAIAKDKADPAMAALLASLAVPNDKAATAEAVGQASREAQYFRKTHGGADPSADELSKMIAAVKTVTDQKLVDKALSTYIESTYGMNVPGTQYWYEKNQWATVMTDIQNGTMGKALEGGDPGAQALVQQLHTTIAAEFQKQFPGKGKQIRTTDNGAMLQILDTDGRIWQAYYDSANKKTGWKYSTDNGKTWKEYTGSFPAAPSPAAPTPAAPSGRPKTAGRTY